MDEVDGEQVYVPVWVCTHPEAAGLHYAYGPRTSRADDDSPSSEDEAERDEEAEARREAESAERRRVIANNKAWKAAEVVRREWLTGLLNRRTVPNGAEVLVARAIIGREYSLSHALQHGHVLLPNPPRPQDPRGRRRGVHEPAAALRPHHGGGDHAKGRDHAHPRRRPGGLGGAQRNPHLAQPQRMGRRGDDRAHRLGLPSQLPVPRAQPRQFGSHQRRVTASQIAQLPRPQP